MIEYLTEEEQYKKSISNEEISRIRDYNLQKIREKYWKLRHQAFMNEHEILDCDLEKVIDKIDAEENIELESYKRTLQKNN